MRGLFFREVINIFARKTEAYYHRGYIDLQKISFLEFERPATMYPVTVQK